MHGVGSRAEDKSMDVKGVASVHTASTGYSGEARAGVGGHG